MDALLFLGLAVALMWGGERWRPATLAAVPVAALAGTTFPDLDLIFGLGHRSGLTHSALVGATLTAAGPRWRPIAAGLALGTGLHLSADVFPNAMRGFATVKLPGAGSIGAWWSYAWLAAHAVASLTLGTILLRRTASRTATAVILAAVAILGVGYLFLTDGGWPALLVFTGTGWAVMRRRG